MTFTTLALLTAVGLAGPLLAAVPRLGTSLVVGEIAAGLAVGRSGLDLVPVDDPALTLLADLGFALLMLIVGTHLPLRRPDLRPAAGRAALAAGVTVAGAAVGGVLLARTVGPDRPAVLAVLLATSSAAVALPVLQALPVDAGPGGAGVLTTTAWVAVADVVTVLAVPFVLPQGPAGSVLVGVIAIAVLAGALLAVARRALRSPRTARWTARLRDRSRTGGWALDLRISLLVLFVLAAVATRAHTSVLLAGFAAGTVLALLGEPRRLAQQLIGLGEGFLIPIFFVTLGARLRLGALLSSPSALGLAGALALGALAVHLLAAISAGLPPGAGLVATAQLGVPAAIANVGLSTGALGPGQAAAVLAAALVSLGACAAGSSALACAGVRDARP